MWYQYDIRLRPQRRGFRLITDDIVSELRDLSKISVGMANLVLQHTSASLTLNENCDPDVQSDLIAWSDRMAPENAPYFRHTCEGPDDMPAHIKSSVFGTTLTLPIAEGRLALGTWQGIWLGEHRNHGGSRRIVATLMGE